MLTVVEADVVFGRMTPPISSAEPDFFPGSLDARRVERYCSRVRPGDGLLTVTQKT
jgi:hypothetical protein